MVIDDYLEFVRPQEGGSNYPRIVVVGPGGKETNIKYVELRPDGDYLRVFGRDVSLRDLTSDAGLGSINYAYILALGEFPEKVRRAEFSFDIEIEGMRMRVDPECILAIARLEDRLASRWFEDIVRETEGAGLG